MRYLSLFSGIEAASVAWKPLGWEPVAFSEIEPFPCAVLAHHYPSVPNWGDVTKHKEWPDERVELVVGGSPCQAFSLAGLRKGLDDPRGNLTLVYLGVVEQYRPRWVVWENVPGVLSIDRGRVFGAFLGALAKLGYGWAYRILDAKYFGSAARRRRVVVIGHLGGWCASGKALFEPESLTRGNPPLRKIAKNSSDWLDGHRQAATIDAQYGNKWGSNQWYLRGHLIFQNGKFRRLTPLEIERCFGFPDNYTAIPNWRRSACKESNKRAERKVEFSDQVQDHKRRCGQNACDSTREMRHLRYSVDKEKSSYRSLPPDKESQGTSLPQLQYKTSDCGRCGVDHAGVGLFGRKRITPDGPRYKALGNSMAVPVMAWIGRRIQMVEEMDDAIQ